MPTPRWFSFSFNALIASARDRKKAAVFAASGLFDAEWYAAAYEDVLLSGQDPLKHFVRHGSRELRDPGPNFNARHYYETYPDARRSRLDPLSHFLRIGKAKRRPTKPSTAPRHQLDPAAAIRIRRRMEVVLASGFFDADWYTKKNRDVAAPDSDPLLHFVRYGSAELRDPGPEFEAKWYAEEYADVEESGLEPLFHYLEVGKAKGYAAKGPPPYQRWRALFDVLHDDDIASIRSHIRASPLPTLAVAMFFDRRTEKHILSTYQHLQTQLYPAWKAFFFLMQDCSEDARELASQTADQDARISSIGVVGLAETSSVLRDEALVLFVKGGVLFREHALYMFAHHAAEAGEAPFIAYADEDRLQGGNLIEPRFKPDYSPILFTQPEYTENCFLLRAPATGLEGLLAAVADESDGVSALFKTAVAQLHAGIRIPFVLYHVEDDAVSAPETTARVAAKATVAIKARPEGSDLAAFPDVSIIIPTKDRIDLLRKCLESLWRVTDYPRERLEVIIIDNGSEQQETLEFLEKKSASGELRLIHYSDTFNFSRLNNLGVVNSCRDVVVLLNNDIEICDSSWLLRLVRFAVMPNVGAVGAKLLYDDRTVQHGGVILGIQGLAAHSHVGIEESQPGYQRLNLLTREVTAVTGACLAMRRSVFFELGGLDTDFAVAFNDVVLCLEARRRGYSNVWASDAVLIHHESRSRGPDTTPEKKRRLLTEARLARIKYPDQFVQDPFYSPNLSLETAYELAFPPRRLAPWRVYARKLRKPRVLMLSSAHRQGYGVAVVLQLQAKYLAGAGFEIFIGGPKHDDDLQYENCTRVALKTPREAAIYAVRNRIDCIVAHTPPFFSVVRFLEQTLPTVFYDYGEPPPELFPDAIDRRDIQAEKSFCATFATRLLAISEAVRVSANEPRMGVVPLGNAHLARWSDSLLQRRLQARERFGWQDKTVVLNVCRFYRSERLYKGVDKFLDVAVQARLLRTHSDMAFVLCGRADEEDVAEVEPFGIEVFANASDTELIDIYCAADIYANFSIWEGYNLGIGQALAMGLPVVASDIPAHRAFPIWRSNETTEIVDRLLALTAGAGKFERRATVTEWEPSHARFAQILNECISEGTEKAGTCSSAYRSALE